MTKLNPYLNFNGNAEEAFNFYKSVFGGKFLTIMRFKDTPDASKFSVKEQNWVMHVALPVGEQVLMGSDVPDSMKQSTGNTNTVALEAESKGKADELFKKLSHGGKVTMPQADMFWGSYFGMLTDKFGVNWMVNYTLPKTATAQKESAAMMG